MEKERLGSHAVSCAHSCKSLKAKTDTWEKQEASEGSGLFLEQKGFGAVGIQTGGQEEVNSRETERNCELGA